MVLQSPICGSNLRRVGNSWRPLRTLSLRRKGVAEKNYRKCRKIQFFLMPFKTSVHRLGRKSIFHMKNRETRLIRGFRFAKTKKQLSTCGSAVFCKNSSPPKGGELASCAIFVVSHFDTKVSKYGIGLAQKKSCTVWY